MLTGAEEEGCRQLSLAGVGAAPLSLCVTQGAPSAHSQFLPWAPVRFTEESTCQRAQTPPAAAPGLGTVLPANAAARTPQAPSAALATCAWPESVGAPARSPAPASPEPGQSAALKPRHYRVFRENCELVCPTFSHYEAGSDTVSSFQYP